MSLETNPSISIKLPTPAYPDKDELRAVISGALGSLPWVKSGDEEVPDIEFVTGPPVSNPGCVDMCNLVVLAQGLLLPASATHRHINLLSNLLLTIHSHRVSFTHSTSSTLLLD